MRERIRRNVGLGMAVILLVSSLGVPPASAGTVREGKSLAEAEMDVLSGPVEYNGSEQKPKVSIHLDGVPLREGVDYRLSYADNLDEEAMIRAIDFVHLHNCRIYMTVNTLVKEKELPELYGYLKPYYEAGLDAVLVQDLGV